MSGTPQHTLVVESRDLDTDERSVATIEVEMPADAAGRLAQLEGLVAELHPRARRRSFDGAAASFLDRERLVVAHYRRQHAKAERSAAPTEQIDQQPLFVA